MTESEMRSLDVGARAPSFRLRKTFDVKVSLEEMLEKGPLLLAFYVFDFGSV